MTSLVTVFYTTGAAHPKGAVAAEQVHEVGAEVIAPQIPLEREYISWLFENPSWHNFISHIIWVHSGKGGHILWYICGAMGEELARCRWVCEPAGAAVDSSRWHSEHQGPCPGSASQHGHAGTHRGRGGCHSADKGTLVDTFNFTWP